MGCKVARVFPRTDGNTDPIRYAAAPPSLAPGNVLRNHMGWRTLVLSTCLFKTHHFLHHPALLLCQRQTVPNPAQQPQELSRVGVCCSISPPSPLPLRMGGPALSTTHTHTPRPRSKDGWPSSVSLSEDEQPAILTYRPGNQTANVSVAGS